MSDAATDTEASSVGYGGVPTALLAVLRPVRTKLLAAMAAEAAATACLVVTFVAVVDIGRGLLRDSDQGNHHAIGAAVVAVVAYVVRTVLAALAATVAHLADADFQVELRRRIATHLGRLPLGWFADHDTGDVRKLAHDDVTALHIVVAHTLVEVIGAIVLPLAVFGYLLSVDVGLAFVSLLPLVVGLIFYRIAMRDATRLMPQFYLAMGRINAAVTEFVRGITVVRSFGQAGRAHRSFRKATDEFNDFFEEWSGRTTRDTGIALTALAAPASLLLLAVTGYVWLRQGWLDPLGYVAFLLMGSALTSSVFPLILNTQALSNAQVSATAITRLLDLPSLPVPAEPGRTAGGSVRFERVGFAYRADTPVLRDVDLELVPGTVTAVVGRSGSGKSTLASLLPRFHDVTAGRITLGGVDVRELAPAELYRQVGFVFQDVSLLRLSIADNIRLGRPDATLGQVEAAARDAAVHDRIAELPRGYDSVIGEDVTLSGGESQRVAIARALLADAPILVLDEAASYADPDSEAQVQQALSRLARGRTVLTIAHRLQSIAGADQIVVLDSGSIAERGRHDELLAADGVYARLWRSGGGADVAAATTVTARGTA